MKKKLNKLTLCSFLLAVLTFAATYLLCHYVTPEGQLTPVFREEAGKPMITLWLGQLGTMFLFSGIISLLITGIFRSQKA